ncbi:hypothetical protein BCR34DRAFT_584796 [Clohesyomyces aquaticus]|uniref:Uncharacterized protein n=1 Tax=Clohesyomyces aquaticus TaxID=1231657 RepID=A0A1Y2A067_9PLEO|nr:hypothetical protein BCR34DRAFT_584796 [Clohesyomyces aquaticus]
MDAGSLGGERRVGRVGRRKRRWGRGFRGKLDRCTGPLRTVTCKREARQAVTDTGDRLPPADYCVVCPFYNYALAFVYIALRKDTHKERHSRDQETCDGNEAHSRAGGGREGCIRGPGTAKRKPITTARCLAGAQQGPHVSGPQPEPECEWERGPPRAVVEQRRTAESAERRPRDLSRVVAF